MMEGGMLSWCCVVRSMVCIEFVNDVRVCAWCVE